MAPTTAERVRDQIERLAVTGLDWPTFASAALDVLNRAVPFTSACLATADPATELITGTVKWGELRDIHDGEWARFEYEVPDLYTFQDVARRPGHVVSLRAETDGRPDRSVRFAEFLRPSWGYTDELRAALRADGHTWGFFALFRDRHHSEFTAAEHEFTSRVATAFAIGLRTGLLATAVGTVPVSGGPAVLVIGPDDEICQTSLGAADRVAELGGGTLGESPLPLALRSLVGAARRFAAEGRAVLPKVRLRTRSGQWMIAHASPLLARDGHTADVVVTIEEARPPEIVPLVVAAFGLTPRERDVVRLVLQGVGTGEVAKTLHMSTYTVQDHLKSIFTKAGVRSRRELTAKVFYDQYAPRLAGAMGLTPSGWFADPA